MCGCASGDGPPAHAVVLHRWACVEGVVAVAGGVATTAACWPGLLLPVLGVEWLPGLYATAMAGALVGPRLLGRPSVLTRFLAHGPVRAPTHLTHRRLGAALALETAAVAAFLVAWGLAVGTWDVTFLLYGLLQVTFGLFLLGPVRSAVIRLQERTGPVVLVHRPPFAARPPRTGRPLPGRPATTR